MYVFAIKLFLNSSSEEFSSSHVLMGLFFMLTEAADITANQTTGESNTVEQLNKKCNSVQASIEYPREAARVRDH